MTKQKLKDKQEETKERPEKPKEELLDCRQHLCRFQKEGGCHECEECHAPPLKVKESCQRCFDCEFKPNSLRWADDNAEMENEIVNKLKQVIGKAMEDKRKEAEKQILKVNQPAYQPDYCG